jgi:catechol 2,3-dioxygenase-like lactoylglutathione lyase family enzyme
MPESLGRSATPSHLILHVSDTSATVRFYQSLFGVTATDDHSFGSPSLDAIFGRTDVRIRSTFIDVFGYRLHTIETLDVARPPRAEPSVEDLGLSGLSFAVPDLDHLHDRATAGGLNPTPIYEFSHEELDHVARMFFLADPDYVRLELIAAH